MKKGGRGILSLPHFKSLEDDQNFVRDQMAVKFGVGGMDDNEEEEAEEFNSKAFAPLNNTLSCFLVTHNGKGVYTGAFNGGVSFRKISKPKKPITHGKPHNHVRVLAVTADQRILFTGGSDNIVKMCRGNHIDHTLEQFRTNSRVMCICLFENKKNLFVGTYSGRICGWKYNTGKDLPHFRTPKRQHERMVYCLRIIGGDAGAGTLQGGSASLLSTSEDKTIKQWKIATGEQIGQMSVEFPVYDFRLLKTGRCLLQNFKDAEMWKLGSRRGKGGSVLENLEKEHIFVNITTFDVTPNHKILVGWNRLLGRFEFWDVENKVLLYDKRLYDTVFLNSLTHVPKFDVGKKKKRVVKKVEDLKREAMVAPSEEEEDEEAEKGEDKKKSETGGEEENNFFVYYLSNKSLGRSEVKYSELLKKHEQSSRFNVRQAYLNFEELFKRATETFTYDKVEAAQAIQRCVETEVLTTGMPLDVQINKFFDFFSANAQVEYEDDYKKKLRKISLEKVAFSETVPASSSVDDMSSDSSVEYSKEEMEMDLIGKRRAFDQKIQSLKKEGKFTLIIQKSNILGDALSIFQSQFDHRKHCGEAMVCFTTQSNKGFEKILADHFFEILCEKILDLLFVRDQKRYFNETKDEVLAKTLKFMSLNELYTSAGRVLGYCLFHGFKVPFHVPNVIYKMLMGLSVVYEDLETVFPRIYKALDEVLTSEDDERDVANVLDEFCTKTDQTLEVDADIKLNSMEKYAFAQKYAKHYLIESKKEHIEAFVKGFHDMIGPEYLKVFSEGEMEVVICGFKKIDIDLWKSCCIFSNCARESEIIKWFFDVVSNELTFKEQALLFNLVTDEYSLDKKKGLEPIPLITVVDLRDLANKIKPIKCNSVYNTVELPKYFSKFQLSENIKKLLIRHLEAKAKSDM